MEADFDKVPGVRSTTSGYNGGKVANPTYEQVSAKSTGHAEAVEIVFDPAKVSCEQLLEHYWRSIDPKTQDRQFCDSGSPVPHRVFALDAAQLKAAQASLAALEKSKPFSEAHRHADRAGRPLLCGRGLSSGRLQEEPDPLPVRPHELRAG